MHTNTVTLYWITTGCQRYDHKSIALAFVGQRCWPLTIFGCLVQTRNHGSKDKASGRLFRHTQQHTRTVGSTGPPHRWSNEGDMHVNAREMGAHTHTHTLFRVGMCWISIYCNAPCLMALQWSPASRLCSSARTTVRGLNISCIAEAHLSFKEAT